MMMKSTNLLITLFTNSITGFKGMSGGGGGNAKDAARAQQEEAARLAALKTQEEARILKETLDNKIAVAGKESAAATARTSLMDKAKTALEDPAEAAKKKTLLSNYSSTS